MKFLFTLVVLLIFCLSALWGNSVNDNQVRKPRVPSKTAANSVSKDTLSQNTIHINGKDNVVSINSNNVTDCKEKIARGEKKTTSTIDINGEANAVNIQQNGQNGNVNINQNGNGNRVNVSQSKAQE